MALSASSLKARMITELTAIGFVVTGEHAKAAQYAEAISKAIVAEFQENAKAVGTDTPSGDNHDLSIT